MFLRICLLLLLLFAAARVDNASADVTLSEAAGAVLADDDVEPCTPEPIIVVPVEARSSFVLDDECPPAPIRTSVFRPPRTARV